MMVVDRLSIREFRGSDEAELVSLWNTCLARDPLTPAVFRTRVLLDANFSADGLLLAYIGEKLTGFVLSIVRQVPFYLLGLEPELGWITAFGVHPEFRRQGIGRQLFDRALQRMRDLGRRQVSISPYTPNYFIPGVDVNAYEEALAFLKALGWQITARPIAMQANLGERQTSVETARLGEKLAEDGISVRPVEPGDLPELMPFISGHFGWDWLRFAQEYLLQLFGPGADDIVFLVARSHGTIVGYCQQRRERFGPFGVLPELRGRGIGSLLLARCLESMYARGFHCAWFLWTGKHNQRIYSQAGFEPVREFAVLNYELKG